VCDYSQVLVIDFTESFAPVIKCVSLSIIFSGMMVWNLKVKIIDIESAPPYYDLEKSIFMDIPCAMELTNCKCIVLKKRIYGLVQSA
jgi:hypothetical protein